MDIGTKSFYESLPFPIVVCDMDGKVQAISEHFCKNFLYSIQDLEGKDVPSFILGAETDWSTRIFLQGGASKYNSSFVDDEGFSKKVKIEFHKVRHDEHAYIVFTITLIQRPQIQNHSHFESAIGIAGIGTWEYFPDEDEASFSEKFLDIFGINISEHLTWNKFRSLIHRDDLPIFDVFFINHIEFDIPLNFEFRSVIRGKVHWFSIRGKALWTDNGKLRLLGVLMDCSKEKEVLSELNNAVEAKKLALEAGHIGTWQGRCPDGIQWLWDWDNMANKMFHINPEDVGNLDRWVERLHPEDAESVQNKLIDSLTSGSMFEVDYRVSLPTGEIIFVYAKGVVNLELDGKTRRIDGVCIDLTDTITTRNELTRLNAELEQRVTQRTNDLQVAIAKAEQASQAKSDFLAMMSHELRTPMNAIIGSLELAGERTLDYETKDLIETSKVSADNLVAILNDILDLNKIESGKLELEDIYFSISEVIDQIIKIFIPVAEKKGVVLEVIESPSIPNMVKGDQVRVRQILFNLLGNAIKFTDTYDGHVGKVIVEVGGGATNASLTEVTFAINDNGIGIDTETQHKLFSPFIQAEKSTSRKYGGTGLGLAISGKLADMMGGWISLVSELNHGSTFTLHLPVWVADDMEQSELAFVEHHFDFLVLNSELVELAERTKSYIEQEAGSVRFMELSKLEYQLYTGSSWLVVFAGQYEAVKSEFSQLLELIPNEHLIALVDKEQQDNFRNVYGQLNYLLLKPATKVSLLDNLHSLINHSLADLHFQAPIDEPLELALDFDFDCALEGTESGPSVQDESQSKADILIVEDNEFNLQLILKQMKKLGYSAEVAEDGVSGFNSWKSFKPKLILTDCHMPNMNGYEMTKAIREIEATENIESIPIIAITGAAMAGDEEHCKAIGMSDFVSKPVKLNTLKLVMERWYA